MNSSTFFGLKNDVFFMLRYASLQEAPRAAQEAPRPPQEAPKSAPGGLKRSPRDPKSRSRGLKTLQDRPKRLQNITIRNTIAHVNLQMSQNQVSEAFTMKIINYGFNNFCHSCLCPMLCTNSYRDSSLLQMPMLISARQLRMSMLQMSQRSMKTKNSSPEER